MNSILTKYEKNFIKSYAILKYNQAKEGMYTLDKEDLNDIEYFLANTLIKMYYDTRDKIQCLVIRTIQKEEMKDNSKILYIEED